MSFSRDFKGKNMLYINQFSPVAFVFLKSIKEQ